MTMKCVLCGAPADWRRPPKKGKGLEVEAGYCDAHTPPWRIDEYEPMTTVAVERRERAHAPLADDEPKTRKKTRKKATHAEA